MTSWSMRAFDISAIALAVACGVGSLILFALYPLGSYAIFRFSSSEHWLLCWDALLSLTFFVQHSGMNRRRFRVWLSTWLASRYHGALYGIASGAALTLVVAFWRPCPSLLLVLHGTSRWLARALGALAFGLFIWSAASLLKFDPLGLEPITAHLKGTPSPLPRFIVRGPYRWVRHPLYSCAIIMIWTWPELTTDRLLFNLLWTIWICVGAHLEERDLASDFGEVYRDYQARVPMLIPWRGRTALKWVAVGIALASTTLSSAAFAQSTAPDPLPSTGSATAEPTPTSTANAETPSADKQPLLAASSATLPSHGDVKSPPSLRLAEQAPAPAPVVPRTEKMHDGFYVRVSLGFGTQWTTIDDSTPRRNFSAKETSMVADLLVGGAPSPGIILGGALLLDSLPSTRFEADGTAAKTGLSLATVGPFIDGYPNSRGGFHSGGMLGASAAHLTGNNYFAAENAYGFGLATWLGYDCWVADQWSVGGLLRFAGAHVFNRNDSSDVGVYARSIALLLTAVYQ